MRFSRGDDRFRRAALLLIDFLLVDFLLDLVLLVEDCAAASGFPPARFKHTTATIREMQIRVDDNR